MTNDRKRNASIYIIIMMLCMLISGCNNRSDSEDKSESSVAAQTEQPVVQEEKKQDYNPLELKDYEYKENSLALNDSKDVNLMATLKVNNEIDGKRVSQIIVDGIKGNNAIVEYTVFIGNKEDAQNTEFEGGVDPGLYKHHIAAIDITDFSVKKDITLDGGWNTCVYNNVGNIYTVSSDTDLSVVTGYDYELNETFNFEYKSMSGIYFNDDMSGGYYVIDEKLMYYDIVKKSSSEIKLVDKYKIDYISSVFTMNDKDYIGMWAQTYTTAEYEIVVEVPTGKTMKIIDNSSNIYFINDTNNRFVCSESDAGNYTGYIVADENGDFVNYRCGGDILNEQIKVLEDGRILFVVIRDGTIALELYKGLTLCASTRFTIERTQEDSYLGYYLSGQPLITENKSILLALCDEASEKEYIFKWTPEANNLKEENFKAKAFDINSIKSVKLDETMDLSGYVPSKLSDNLKPLREKADEMQEQYKVKICIGEECCDVISGYAIDALTDYDKVSAALDELEVQLKRYPENFFGQFIYDTNKGVEIYLTDTLRGVDDYNLSTAGGFEDKYEDYDLLVMDASEAFYIDPNFNHELCHAIDKKISWDNIMAESYCLSDEKWEKLNPKDKKHGTCYTNDYKQFGYDENMKYTYENTWTDSDQVYFIDGYSMVNPLEDRARLFEEAMTGSRGVNFSKCPNLKKKLDYYAKCIEENFNTDGWKDVPWVK